MHPKAYSQAATLRTFLDVFKQHIWDSMGLPYLSLGKIKCYIQNCLRLFLFQKTT